jgi:cortexillin 1/2
LALCDKYVDNKEKLNFSSFDKEKSNENLNAAFEIAEKELGIPKLLEPSEVSSGNVDDRSLVLYISLYFHAFVAKQQQLGIMAQKEKTEERLRALEGSLEDRAKLASDLEIDNKKLLQEINSLK